MLTTTALLAASAVSSSSGNEGIVKLALVVALLAAGPFFYRAITRRYRNADARHDYRRDTRSTAHDVRSTDVLVRHLTRLSHKSMRGANHRS